MKFVVSLATALFAGISLATDPLTTEGLVAGVKTEELERNLYNLNEIAKKNGGNRAFGRSGYKASGDYVLERAVTRFSSHYDTTVQYFNHTYEETRKITVTGPSGEDVFVITLLYNTPTPLPGGISAPLIDTPINDATGSGCLESDWAGIDATGKIALVKRGICAISQKLKLARVHGALAVILWNQNPGLGITAATLGAENVGLMVPVGVIRNDVGLAWKALLAAGQSPVVKLLVDAFVEPRETFNIIVESKAGDPNNVIMLGAHLDSVQAGAGINDDGSGTTALIEIMTALRYYRGYKNKIRFAWWGAEEAGLAGSWYYTRNLAAAEADKIRFYSNYDMIGSIQPIFAVQKGDNPGDVFGADLLASYLEAAGKTIEYEDFSAGNSDYAGFVEIGIPTSGLFTGAGAPTDPCYHLACDDINNINWDALTVNAKAAAFQLATLALSDLKGLPPRSKTTINPRARTQVRNELARMKRAQEESSHGKSCSHSGVKATI